MITPLSFYQNCLAKKKLQENSQQLEAVCALNKLHKKLHPTLPLYFLHTLLPNWIVRKFSKQPEHFYFYGSVGAGKTVLLDIFFKTIRLPKARYHFHDFMEYIHNALSQEQGKADPIRRIIKKMRYKVLCLDELCLVNIGDAVIIGKLFELLFKKSISLVITSNAAPDALYKDGINRELFLATIQQIKENMYVFPLNVSQDYRLTATKSKSYLSKAKKALLPTIKMQSYFHNLALKKGEKIFKDKTISLLGRKIATLYHTTESLYCSLDMLCGRPRSQRDYLFLAKSYSAFFITDMPNFSEISQKTLYAFIYLIDVLYDQKKHLLISCQLPLGAVYLDNQTYPKLFKRTLSRLIEMQANTLCYMDNL